MGGGLEITAFVPGPSPRHYSGRAMRHISQIFDLLLKKTMITADFEAVVTWGKGHSRVSTDIHCLQPIGELTVFSRGEADC